jgi:hypothetical protein
VHRLRWNHVPLNVCNVLRGLARWLLLDLHLAVILQAPMCNPRVKDKYIAARQQGLMYDITADMCLHMPAQLTRCTSISSSVSVCASSSVSRLRSSPAAGDRTDTCCQGMGTSCNRDRMYFRLLSVMHPAPQCHTA